MMRISHTQHSKRERRRRRIWRWSIRFGLLLALAGSAAMLHKVVEINQEFVANAWSVPQPQTRSLRPVYPYSVVPGGVYSVAELFDAVQKDPVVREHYQGVIKEAVFREALPQDVQAHVSYRVGNQVYWTSKVVTVKAGEQVLTDGHALIRSRCGNLLNSTMRIPVDPPRPPAPEEPPEIVFETKMPPLVPPPIVPPAAPTLLVVNRPPAIAPPILPVPNYPSVTPVLPPEPNPQVPVLGPPVWPVVSKTPSPPLPPPAPVPEPASMVLLGTGLASLGVYIRKNRQKGK